MQSKPPVDVRSHTKVSSPAVPPGLSLPGDFPPLVAPQQRVTSVSASTQRSNAASSGPPIITPIVPLMSAQSAQATGLNKMSTVSDNPSTTTGVLPADTALAMDPEIKASFKSKEGMSTNMSKTASVGLSKASGAKVESPRKAETRIDNTKPSKLPTRSTEKHQRPEKLDLAAAKDATKRDMGSILQSTTQSRPTTPTNKTAKADPLIPSQPSTPVTAASQASSSPVPRPIHARTIRVVQTPKSEMPLRLPIMGANPTSQTAPTSKQPSRQPSLASIKQPGTPLNETVSDIASVTSTSHSRPGSPPPSKVGSAPIRQSTKSQQKKDRQARARLVEESNKNEDGAAAAVVEEPIQAPIIGRKKKTKKTAGEVLSESTSAGIRPLSPKSNEDNVPDTIPSTPTTPIKEIKIPVRLSKKEPKKDAPQTRQHSKEPDVPIPPTPSDIRDALHKTLPSVASIFAELQNSGQIPHALDLFRPVPGINYRYDLTESDLTEPKALPPLTESQRHTLDRGDAICVETSNDKRVVILPDRRILRGFTPEQAKRYLDLRKQYLTSSGPTVFNSVRHSIEKWLHNTPLSTVPFEGPNLASRNNTLSEHFSFRGDSLEFTDHFDSPMTRQGPMATNYWSCAGGGDGVGMKMQGEEGRVVGISVEEAEKALGVQRKETEGLEKRLGGLVRKNRRLLVGSGR